MPPKNNYNLREDNYITDILDLPQQDVPLPDGEVAATR